MVVLSRKPGEEVVIGDNIRLTVLAIRGNHVRLRFTAPPDVAIHREELSQRSEGGETLAVGPAILEAES
jgi:carbon storage regulator